MVIVSSILSGNTVITNAATNDGGGKCTYKNGTKGTVYGGGKTCCVGPSTVSCEAITTPKKKTKKTNSKLIVKKTNKKPISITKISTNNKSKIHANHSYIS